ncbi:MAG TPA: GNA1162 family protein [Desulfatiglandales bacterium]|nr:GNA1162 family protein [Desulfatiglandales bacterium]
MTHSFKRKVIVGLVFLFILPGCVVATKKGVVPPPIRSLYEGEFKVGEYLKDHQPKTVAILPFKNETKKEEAFEIVRRTFYNHFSSLRYGDLELFKVDQRLKKTGFTDPDEINKLSSQRLGKILGVDAVIYGRITHYDRAYAAVYSKVSVGAAVKMVDTKTNEFLWSGQHVQSKHQGGVPTTPVGLIITAISTAANIRQIELLRTSDDLFRDMVKTIPGPTVAEASRPPAIKMLVHDAVGSPKKAGDIIKVALEGDPHCAASFDIGDFKQAIEMKEIQSGFYEAKYQVRPGDNAHEAIITGYLTDERGNTAQWMDVIGAITIDTTPPNIPTSLSTISHDHEVVLTWDTNKEEDLAQYKIYRSQTPLTGYESIVFTEFNTIADTGITNYTPFYYKVSALDKAANESELSPSIKGMAIPPGPTPVSGEILKDTIWYAGASPYVIENDIHVRPKVTLVIEPGTRIESMGGSIVIQGQLQAVGDKEGMIIFDGFKGGQWAGIIFDRVKNDKSNVSFCQVKNALVGLTILSSSPFVNHIEFSKNETGILIKGSFSTSQVTENYIHSNTDSGIIVSEASSPVITGNTIKRNGMHGLFCDGGNPLIRANSIVGSSGDGIHVVFGRPQVMGNNIHDNSGLAIVNSPKGEPIQASDNWWGSADPKVIFSSTMGKVIVNSALDSLAPNGKPFTISVVKGPLGGCITANTYLILAHSPYVVEEKLEIDNGATLYIQPGVTVSFNPGSSGIEVKDGGIYAKGRKDEPIRFISNSPSPAAGDYHFAVKSIKKTKTASFFKFCRFQHGVNGLIIEYGKPDITYSLISDNSQSGIMCGKDSSPKIEYNTLIRNRGTGAIFCKATSAPRIHYNNFLNNPFAIQSFSKIQIDARNNWWGNNPPDESLFIGNVTYRPWLETYASKACGE